MLSGQLRPSQREGMMIFGYSIIGAIIVGLILGVLAKLFLRGKQPVPLWLTILVGIVAAIIGNYVATLFGVADTFGFDWIRHGLQLLFAIIGIALLAGVYAKKAGTS
ncbi:GlsB/YeaQ/YmgE family stress response membrane protein [Pseudonocardia sp.]|uniref:GlsB/YeaQ/YmgE family stress response membrane protein n=1 Tax=Pseudonocardia sp. TaxID=60912 RepID=UPI003D0E0E39